MTCPNGRKSKRADFAQDKKEVCMSIKIKGIIGSDVVGSEFTDRISKLTGDIEFEIDSPGGSVFHGISIFNAIKNYNRGKKTMHVVGECSSMAAYIMLAGDGSVLFEPNSVVCIHNPWSIATGDYIEMKKQAQLLEDLACLYAKAFVDKGLFSKREIQQIMDAETWFVGAEKLKRLGTVLKTAKKEDEAMTEEIKIAASRAKMAEAKAKIKVLSEENFDSIAALLRTDTSPEEALRIMAQNDAEEFQIKDRIALPLAAVRNDRFAKSENQNEHIIVKGETQMFKNLEDVKAQTPEIFNEIKELGIKEERKRVNSLIKFLEISKEATVKAITEGTSLSDDEFQSSILYARIKNQEIKAMESSNPPAVSPQIEIHAEENPDGNPNKNPQETPEEKEKKTIDAVIALMKKN